MKLCCTAVMLALLVGCGTASRVVRLDTGQANPLVFTPRSSARPVALGNGEFEEAVSELARDVRPPTRPQESARRLFEVEARSGSYTYELPSRRITPLEPGEHLEGQSTTPELELTRDYLRWCERTGRPGDCLRLLTESSTVNGDGRFALAMALAKGAVLDEMLEAFKDMADPHSMVAAVLWTWTTYMLLVSIPDVTVSKGLAAVMTATLISYVGVDTFWGLVVGFKRLMDEADRATSFHELRAAGERYGKLMGRNAARAFAMLAMAAIGNTAPGLAAKVPKLPGSMQAAVQAETQVGIRLAAVGEVESVAVSAETVTIALAPGAVAMTAQGTSGGGNPKKDIVIPEGRAKHIFRDAPGHLRDTPTHRQLLQEVASDESARLGTDKFGNEWFARTNPDGTQVWVQVRHGEIINGGLNQVPRNYNAQMGLSAPSKP
ncbi:SitA5 family polymorphic toxin [Archangium violaceum]|uniref:SitA5 family polymorphic toxin n=1 Tax=Archangium violaceum TaxID=83451 RepID=UPI0036D94E23